MKPDPSSLAAGMPAGAEVPGLRRLGSLLLGVFLALFGGMLIVQGAAGWSIPFFALGGYLTAGTFVPRLLRFGGPPVSSAVAGSVILMVTRAAERDWVVAGAFGALATLFALHDWAGSGATGRNAAGAPIPVTPDGTPLRADASDAARATLEEPGIERVRFDDVEVVRTMAEGRSERIRWDDLVEVGIVTTDEGPLAEDVYWILVARDGAGGCAIPSGADGADALLARLQKLPGFDNEMVIQAMTSTGNARFVCWRRAESPEAG